MTDVILERLDGPATLAVFGDIQTVYHQAFPSYDLEGHARRTTSQTKAKGFGTVTARVDGQMVGFVYGLPFTSQINWWKDLDPAGPEGFDVETGDRTVAVIDLCVLPSYQGQGLGRRLMTEFLASRDEERATLTTAPHESEVKAMYERWGWHKIGQIPGAAGTTEPLFDVYVIDLRSPANSSR